MYVVVTIFVPANKHDETSPCNIESGFSLFDHLHTSKLVCFWTFHLFSAIFFLGFTLPHSHFHHHPDTRTRARLLCTFCSVSSSSSSSSYDINSSSTCHFLIFLLHARFLPTISFLLLLDHQKHAGWRWAGSNLDFFVENIFLNGQ